MTRCDKPLVSLCVSSYNVEDYIVGALEGAFNQTYRRLEIVISDDCSKDETFARIEECLNRHSVGADDGLTVKLLRNDRNRGSVGNWERLCAAANGELIVKADGDDVSLPMRVERIVSEWIADGRRATLIVSNGVKVTVDQSRCLGFVDLTNSLCEESVMGAVSAYATWAIREFGPSKRTDPFDDQVYSNRMLMLGSVLKIPEILVAYRVGSGLASARCNDYRGPVLRVMKRELSAMAQLSEDVNERMKMGGRICNHMREVVEHRKLVLDAAVNVFSGSSFVVRLMSFRKYKIAVGGKVRSRFVWILLLLPAVLSDPLLNLREFVKYHLATWRNRNVKVRSYLPKGDDRG